MVHSFVNDIVDHAASVLQAEQAREREVAEKFVPDLLQTSLRRYAEEDVEKDPHGHTTSWAAKAARLIKWAFQPNSELLRVILITC